MLRRFHKQAVEDGSEGKLERKRSKRQRIVQFFRSRKQKPQGLDEQPAKHAPANEQQMPQQPSDETKPAKVAVPKDSSSIVPEKRSPVESAEQTPPPATPPERETKEEEKAETLSEPQLHALFAGAPQFGVTHHHDRPTPAVSFPWDGPQPARDVSDSKRIDEPAFQAATLRTTQAISKSSSSQHGLYQGYKLDVVEVPSMLDAQGIEPGSIGFTHFLELPKSDCLLSDTGVSRSSQDLSQAERNKEQLQNSPERIGIRAVNMPLVYDRLIEIQDLYEAFHDSPGPMSILNHQSPGELYANLFSKFLTPPGYDGAGNDPTGLRIQILTLMRILELKGIWYDFSLVEWRIRLGQILWSDPDAIAEHEPHPPWTEREVLLLQITLACELLLRLDAVSAANADDTNDQVHIDEQELHNFLGTKTRKLDWDLVLARRFLDNILVVKNSDHDLQDSKSRKFFGIFTGNDEPEASRQGIVLMPKHQARQVSGLIKFASMMQWPNTDTLMQELATNLGASDLGQDTEPLPSPEGMFLEPVTPASISVYGTPLQTPRSTSHVPDGYFGNVGKPKLSRDNSQSLRIPLSPALSATTNRSNSAPIGIGGWLSRSYLTGLVLPGEPISHFLISTLLENDKAAIAGLGDANLYGGFTYAGRAWFSKNCIVGRVFACSNGAAESMGWITFPKPPTGLNEQWHSIHSEQLPFDDRLSSVDHSDLVADRSAPIPSGNLASLLPNDLVLPRDDETNTAPSVSLSHWELTALNPDLIDQYAMSGPPTESDIHVPSITFIVQDKISTHTMTLGFDVHFITSMPCSPPASTPAPSLPQILKRSLTGMSRTSSKHSGNARLSRRNSHGFEPLLSHPPDSTDIAPKPMYPIEDEIDSDITTKRRPMDVHPLHKSYSYRIVPVTDVLHPQFQPPFDMHVPKPTTRPSSSDRQKGVEAVNDKLAVLVLDSRGSAELELLARAWCAEKGYHAVICRAGRTCLACCIREARAVGLNVVIRV